MSAEWSTPAAIPAPLNRTVRRRGAGVMLVAVLAAAAPVSAFERPFNLRRVIGASVATDTSIAGACVTGALVDAVFIPLRHQMQSILRVIRSAQALYDRVAWTEQPRRKMELWWRLYRARRAYESLRRRYWQEQRKRGRPVDPDWPEHVP